MARCVGFWILAVLIAVSSRCFAEEKSGVAIEILQNSVDFRVGKELVTRYHIGPNVAKPYFWPLYGPPHPSPSPPGGEGGVRGPGGVAMTRAWPMEKAPAGGSTDHPHQKSVWFCHGDVIAEGLTLKNKERGVEGVDFWSETNASGRIVCTKVEKSQDKVETQNRWQTADGVPVLEEKRVLDLHDFGETRLLVVEIDLEARYFPITFGDTKEGSFGIRVNDLIREEKGNGKIENAEGKVGEKDCWGRVSAWCDYSGTIDGQKVGVAILADPDNPYRSCWHARGYGLMAANPFGRDKSGFPDLKGKTELVKLAKGEHLKIRYGLLIHPGDAKEGKVSEYYERFVKLKK